MLSYVIDLNSEPVTLKYYRNIGVLSYEHIILKSYHNIRVLNSESVVCKYYHNIREVRVAVLLGCLARTSCGLRFIPGNSEFFSIEDKIKFLVHYVATALAKRPQFLNLKNFPYSSS